MTSSVTVVREISAPSDKVWSMITDLTRMGEWSPENTGGTWIKGATGPALGAVFKGTNKNGWRKWSTIATVSACQEGKAFEFDVSALGLKVARWSYLVEPTENGCKVSETFTDLRNSLIKLGGKPISGVSDRDTHNRSTMEVTLENLAKAAETAEAAS